jgi:thymidylate synthase
VAWVVDRLRRDPVELASLQHHVAGQLGVPVGRLLMIVTSAHVDATEEAYVRGILAG